ncbi:MAG TPA: hypothetical protein VGI47_11770, partial [Candidatus Binataceae bacterium]
MKITVAGSLIAVLGLTASYAIGGTHVARSEDESTMAAKAAADWHHRYDHPKPILIASPDVQFVVTYDHILRSCCRPADLVVQGKVTNTTSKAINYVKMEMLFRGSDGKIVYRENAYNRRAVTMGEDEETQKILGDTPHFDPLPAGATD